MPLIEFLGLPASGKTTVATELAARLAAEGIASHLAATLPLAGGRNLPRKLLRAALAAAVEPAILLAALAAVLRSRQRRPSDALRTLSNLLEVRYVLHAAGRGIVIMDQGPGQAVWSLAYSARRPAAQGLRPLLQDGLPRRRLIVVVGASGGQAAARSAARGTSLGRVEREGGPAVLAWARAVRALRVAERAIGSGRLLRVANPDGGAGEAAAGIRAAIRGP